MLTNTHLQAMRRNISQHTASISTASNTFIYNGTSAPPIAVSIGQKIYATVLAESARYLLHQGSKSELLRYTIGRGHRPSPESTPSRKNLLTQIDSILSEHENILLTADSLTYKKIQAIRNIFFYKLAFIVSQYGYTENDLGRVQDKFSRLTAMPIYSYTVTNTQGHELYRERIEPLHQLTRPQLRNIKRNRCRLKKPAEDRLRRDFAHLPLFHHSKFKNRDGPGLSNCHRLTTVLPANPHHEEKTIFVFIAGFSASPHLQPTEAQAITTNNYHQLHHLLCQSSGYPSIEQKDAAYKKTWGQDAKLTITDLNITSPLDWPWRILSMLHCIKKDNDDTKTSNWSKQAIASINANAASKEYFRSATVPFNTAGSLFSSIDVTNILTYYSECLTQHHAALSNQTHPLYSRINTIQRLYKQLNLLCTLGPDLDHLIPVVILQLHEASEDLIHLHCKSSKDRAHFALTLYFAVEYINHAHETTTNIITEIATEFTKLKRGQDNDYMQLITTLEKRRKLFEIRASAHLIQAYAALGQQRPKAVPPSYLPGNRICAKLCRPWSPNLLPIAAFIIMNHLQVSLPINIISTLIATYTMIIAKLCQAKLTTLLPFVLITTASLIMAHIQIANFINISLSLLTASVFTYVQRKTLSPMSELCHIKDQFFKKRSYLVKHKPKKPQPKITRHLPLSIALFITMMVVQPDHNESTPLSAFTRATLLSSGLGIITYSLDLLIKKCIFQSSLKQSLRQYAGIPTPNAEAQV